MGKKTDGTIEYSNLFEETAHFLQDELGIMAQKDGMKGHSNIEYQAKIMSAIMSLGVSSSKEDIITNNFKIDPLGEYCDNTFYTLFANQSPTNPMSLSQFESLSEESYEKFLNEYSTGDNSYDKYSQYDAGESWNWQWEKVLGTIGVNIKP